MNKDKVWTKEELENIEVITAEAIVVRDSENKPISGAMRILDQWLFINGRTGAVYDTLSEKNKVKHQ